MKISEILSKYDTDKIVGHSYGEAYDKLFEKFDRNAEISILEIGIQKGGSLCAWRDYFPNAAVTGVDIVDAVKPEYRRADIAYVLNDIKKWNPPYTFDIIIDDGSHFTEDVLYVIDNYEGKLRPGGLLIVEDIQDESLWKDYELIRTGANYDDLLLIIRK